MSFAESMKRAEELANVRDARVRDAWAAFYDACSVGDVVRCINDYLADFDFSGARVGRRYELGVSLCLAEALDRALRRQEWCASRWEPLASALGAYNTAITDQDGRSINEDDVGSMRLVLAAAALEAE